jgi:phosphoadenosine phosphosulfate reductase
MSPVDYATPVEQATPARLANPVHYAIPHAIERKFHDARSLVAAELRAFHGDAVLTNSFQAEDMVLLHMALAHRPQLPVVFLDTGYHFAELYAYRDRMATEWRLNLINLLPAQTVAQQESQFGILNQTDPGKCCSLRKVQPLFAALSGYGLWLTGLRREQAKSRAALQLIEDFALPTGKSIRKLSPLADWTRQDVWLYAQQQDIPLVSLYDQGYSSIGCQPCTSLPWDPADPRSGRWGGQKQECGIHIQAQ